MSLFTLKDLEKIRNIILIICDAVRGERSWKKGKSEASLFNLINSQEWTAVLLQGSGTYAVEAVLQTSVPREGGKVWIKMFLSWGKKLIDTIRTIY